MTTTSHQTHPAVTPTLEDQLSALLLEARTDPAVEHPFLARFAAGGFRDNAAVLRRYAVEYSGYAAWFPRYLKSVINRLDEPSHRQLLAENLTEEQGFYGDDDCAEIAAAGIDPRTVQGVPHPQLFRRFCRSIGIGESELRTATPAAELWRSQLLAYLETATPAQAVGALGIGTEYIVRPIYQQLVAGILALGTLRRDEFVFFELHCLVDDKHQADLMEIATDLATRDGSVDGLRDGMRTALKFRNQFWNSLFGQVLDLNLSNPA